MFGASIRRAWDDIFGAPKLAGIGTRAHLVAHVYIDGKEVTKAVSKNVAAGRKPPTHPYRLRTALWLVKVARRIEGKSS